MKARGKVVRFFALAAILCAVAWVLSGELDYWPVHAAYEEAKRHAAAHGLHMEGFLGDIVQESDGIGSCEVAIAFDDVASTQSAKLKRHRSWRLGGWYVTEMAIEDKQANALEQRTDLRLPGTRSQVRSISATRRYQSKVSA